MTIKLKGAGHFGLTQYECLSEMSKSGKCLQITDLRSHSHIAGLDSEKARDLAFALLEWVNSVDQL